MCMCVRVHACVCVRVHVHVHVCFCFTLVVRVRVHLLHAEPAPLLPAAAWLGRLSAASPLAAASLLFPLL